MDTQPQQQSKDMQADILGINMQFADSRIPDMKKVSGKEYVPFGMNNDYPNYLLELYNKSGKHSSIINGKCTYILGKGLDQDYPANEKQSWNELLEPVNLDIENFGGCYLQVIPKLGGGYNYYHLNYVNVRTDESNTKYFYKKDWSKLWNKEGEQELPAFYEGIKEPSVLYYKEYRSGKNVYALPSWVAICNWIESDIEVSKHTLTNAKSGFSASKFINFYNGEPEERKKKAIERRLENAATGAEGKKLLIGFNNDPNKKPTIDDLGESDLTKEDFSVVDDLITGNIFAGHSVTLPQLFGVPQKEGLGADGGVRLKIAYEIFKNTYAQKKQANLEKLVSFCLKQTGILAAPKLVEVEPPIVFTEQTILAVAPKEWILEKLGIDAAKYNVVTASTPQPTTQMVNDVLTNLTGRQKQGIDRIVRQFQQGKVTKAQAALMLKNGYGFTDGDVNVYLGIDDDPMTEDFNAVYNEFDVAEMFAACGSNREDFTIIKSAIYKEGDDVLQFGFDAVAELNETQSKVAEILKKDPKATNEQLAETLGISIEEVAATIAVLIAKDIIKKEAVSGNIIRRIVAPTPKIALPAIKVMYSYEKRSIASGPELLPTSRPFCVKMVGLSKTKLFSRQDIQQISERLGYSVFKRAGGFWNNNGTVDYQCRHEWFKHIVLEKK